ncbi:hypothetical protein [Sphingosinicella terrae]|uniref:hypothetical protein n=1 Tax=Sphingosinicella terrae TaxID=2172047 RepID=UPI000E0DE3C1|nr:hypothetical protein [Sphingosinicella terrae]
MAAFRIREDAYAWFSNVEKTLPNGTIFDLYYFCAVTGLVTGSSDDPVRAGMPTKEMVDYFVNDYKPSQSFLLAMLVIAELKKRKVDLSEEEEVRSTFRELIGGNGDSYLRDEGTRRLNAYASGGYDYLAERFDQKPQSSEEFLRQFADIVGKAAREGPFASS